MQQQKDIKIITTNDGSHSLELPGMDETYHSRHGALTESQYVYIEQGLSLFSGEKPIKVLELGFGTGLNALLTLQDCTDNKKEVEYHTIEAFPLSSEIYGQLNYGNFVLGQKALLDLHEAPWNAKTMINPFFSMEKYHSLIEKVQLKDQYFHLVYYDAFAPSKQDEIWDKTILKKVKASMLPGGVLVTYCAQGAFKRTLKSLGFAVEELPGPPGKKEMVRAVKG